MDMWPLKAEWWTYCEPHPLRKLILCLTETISCQQLLSKLIVEIHWPCYNIYCSGMCRYKAGNHSYCVFMGA